MKTKILFCLLALILASVAFALPSPVVKPVPVTPPEIVKQFLAARAAGQGDIMQSLLSETTPLVPGHSGHLNMGDQVLLGVTPTQAAVLSLLYDPQNKLGFKFHLLDVDPDFPNIVRVQAEPVTGTSMTLQVVVEPDSSAAGALRVDELLTMNCADPRVLLPVVERLRSNANRAVSQQHLHQLGLALIEYAQDNDEKMPDAAHWTDALMRYVKDPSVFHDPCTPAAQKWGYAYNKNLSGENLAMLQTPASTVAFFESTSGVKNASDTGQSIPVPGHYADGTDYGLGDGSVHWFADGTVLSYKLTGK